MSISEQIADKLRALEARIPDVEAGLVVTPEGLTIASALPPDADEERIAAMCAAAHSTAERICRELGKGEAQMSLVRGEGGYILVTSAGPSAILMIMTRPEAKLGLLFLEMRRLAKEIEELVGRF
ncbi:MAG TPA: hypothetical protein ENF34_03755 [Candidatus Bathyarchaeota archaeon]|nr:hypothetical protein [Candidatus Bathyarchaeota archaeon]